MVTAPAPVDNAVREPKLSALRIENEPHEKNSSYHRQKRSHDLRGVLVQCIDVVIHAPHVVRAHTAPETLERLAHLRKLQQRLSARDRRGIVLLFNVTATTEIYTLALLDALELIQP